MDFLRRQRLLLIGILGYLLLALSPPFERLELGLLDLRFRLRGNLPYSPRIAMLDIDTDAFKAEGDWHDWKREKHAFLINVLRRLSARSLGVDILFAEKSARSIDFQALQGGGQKRFSLEELARRFPNQDLLLAEAVSNAGNVYLAQIFEREASFEKYEGYARNKERSLAAQRRFSLPLGRDMQDLPRGGDITPVLAVLARVARGVGFAQVVPDPDGVVRHYPMLYAYRERAWPALPLIMALDTLGVSPRQVRYRPGCLEIPLPGGKLRRVPLRGDGSLLINWAGTYLETYPHISYSALKIIARNLLLRELKVVARRHPGLLFDEARFFALPEVRALAREFRNRGAHSPITFLQQVYYRLCMATALQEEVDRDPDVRLEALATGGVPRNRETRLFLDNIRYHSLLLRHGVQGSNQNALQQLIRRHSLTNQALLRECRRNIREYGLGKEDAPFFVFPPPHVESLPDPLYPSFFKGRTFFYGITATGTHDIKPTPLEAICPMVGSLATVYDNLTTGRFLRRAPHWINLGCLLLVLAGGLLWLERLRSRTLLLAAMLAFLLFTLGNLLLFSLGSLWLNLLAPGVAILLVSMLVSMQHYLREEQEKRHLRTAFSHYLAPTLVDQLIHDPALLRLGGERRQCTVFFSDIAGFTTISEGMTPEGLVELLNEYLSEVTGIILAQQGMLDKYLGDAVMAVFNAPLEVADHAAAACRAALQVQQRLRELGDQWEARGWPRLETRIGINSGPMIAGNMGSRERFDYTVMGDAVNLGSRLEGANKNYGTFIMISESTRELIGAAFVVRELDRIRVKGKQQPVTVYELLGLADEALQP